MKNILVWVGLIVLIAATAVGEFTGIALADWVELAGWSIGMALCVLGIVSKAEKKDWKLYVSIVGIIVGVFLLALAGISKDTITTVITAVFGLVVLIISILPALLPKKASAGN